MVPHTYVARFPRKLKALPEGLRVCSCPRPTRPVKRGDDWTAAAVSLVGVSVMP
jgi:hypothetical protein